jgi:hypothetical protein
MTRFTHSQYGEAAHSSSVSISILLGAIALAAVLGVMFVLSLDDLTIGRKPLDPIPVAASSCSYLRPVHDAAEPARREYLRALSGRSDPRAWGAEAALHAQQLTALKLTLIAAIPHVLARVAAELEHVSRNVTAGLTELAAPDSASDYVRRSAGHALDGNDALNNASDLVGRACGFELSPSVSSLTAA